LKLDPAAGAAGEGKKGAQAKPPMTITFNGAYATEDTQKNFPALVNVTNSTTVLSAGVVAQPTPPPPAPPPTEEDLSGPRFKAFGVNPFVAALDQPFSTFSIDVDSASYTLARNYMNRGLLPPAESVRTEEFVNFFDYAYKAPENETFRIFAECAPSRFGHGLQLLKIGVKGRRLGREEQRPAMLTLLVDTSGSMNQPDRLGLAKRALRLLVGQLAPRDRVAIVQYDSHARLVLAPTAASEKQAILDAIDALQCSGSTNLEEGMRRAYGVAAQNFASKAENRVILLSDGVANLGNLAAEDILKNVEAFRRQGVFLSVFGVGMGTYNDAMLQALADKGDGVYRFLDSEAEAQRVLVDDLAATLNTIGADVKIQVEFNPHRVRQYRQLGYEKRQLRKEDFRNDAVDAGEVGSGQSVTALYELEVEGVEGRGAATAAAPTDQSDATDWSASGRSEWLGVVRVRYRRTDNGKVEEIESPINAADTFRSFDEAPVRFRLAAGVAEFAEILRGSPFAAGSTVGDVAEALRPVALNLSLDGQVQELLRMAQQAEGMSRGE
jgi:Ca-activated chloride channel family protein